MKEGKIMVKQTTISFESKYLRILNNIAKIMVGGDFDIKIDKSYLMDNLSKKSVNRNKLSVSINPEANQLIVFGEEGVNFNDINYINFNNIFTGVVIKDLNIEKHLREKTKYDGTLYYGYLTKIIGQTILDKLTNLNSDNDFTNHQTLNLFKNLTPGIAVLIYAQLVEIGARYKNYNNINEWSYNISYKDIDEGIYRDIDICKFLFEDLQSYFSEDVLVDRVASAISEYISDEKGVYNDINHFHISNFDGKNVFNTIVKCFGKEVFVKAIQKLLSDEQINLNNDKYDYLKRSELKSHFIFANSILNFLKSEDFTESEKEILLKEAMIIFFEKDKSSRYLLHRKWQDMFNISRDRSELPYYLNDFKERFEDSFGLMIDYLKENDNSDRLLVVQFSISNAEDDLDFFNFTTNLIAEHKADSLFKIIKNVQD